MFKLQGFVKVVNPTVQVSEKFSKREFVVTDASSMYPQDIMFQLTQDKCDLGNTIAAGQEVEVHFNLKGRLWTSPTGEEKYFNTLEAWRIDSVNGAKAPAPVAKSNSQVGSQVVEEEDLDLPF
jgi:hypothetical protein